MRTPFANLLLFSACALGTGGWSDCGASLVADPSFDLWCGEHLCAWRIDAGDAVKAPTWNENDWGVELRGNPAIISQPSAAVVSCMKFETLADVEEGASVTLELDFQDDGTIEYSAPVPGNDWAAVQVWITAPTWYTKVRFILHKTGAARAVVAHLRITSSDGCSGDPIPLPDRPLGSPCEADGECASGICALSPFEVFEEAMHQCSTCETDGDCTQGICGIETAPGAFAPFRGCAEPGRQALGQRCMGDAECATGVCCDQICSQCCEGVPCGDGRNCAQRTTWPAENVTPPWQCAPGGGTGVDGEPCLEGDDCSAGSCVGEGDLMLCEYWGTACEDDVDCPGVFGETGCRVAGTLAGTCR